jgi:hypothetical protein
VSWTATLPPSIWNGQVIGSGQCVALVELVTHTPSTASWKAGRKVQGDMSVTSGTAIATFGPDGRYQNREDGSSHAAIYMGQTGQGLIVWDQWVKQPTHERLIRFKAPGDGPNVDNGIAFCVIELAT